MAVVGVGGGIRHYWEADSSVTSCTAEFAAEICAHMMLALLSTWMAMGAISAPPLGKEVGSKGPREGRKGGDRHM